MDFMAKKLSCQSGVGDPHSAAYKLVVAMSHGMGD